MNLSASSCVENLKANRSSFVREMRMSFTDAAVETFISNKIPQVTECNAKDLAEEFPDAPKWVSGFGLLVMFNDQPPEPHRPFVLRLLTRAQMAFDDYSLARNALLELTKSSQGMWSPYFRAMSRFESVLALVYQTLDSVAKRTQKKLFQSNDGSTEDRLNKLYNASKHTIAQIEYPLWLTNAGIETSGAGLAYQELEELLRSLAAVARRWSSTAGVESSFNDDSSMPQ
jgi:hypothetical protein